MKFFVNKVYVVFDGECEDRTVAGVFSSKEKADEFYGYESNDTQEFELDPVRKPPKEPTYEEIKAELGYLKSTYDKTIDKKESCDSLNSKLIDTLSGLAKYVSKNICKHEGACSADNDKCSIQQYLKLIRESEKDA